MEVLVWILFILKFISKADSSNIYSPNARQVFIPSDCDVGFSVISLRRDHVSCTLKVVSVLKEKNESLSVKNDISSFFILKEGCISVTKSIASLKGLTVVFILNCYPMKDEQIYLVNVIDGTEFSELWKPRLDWDKNYLAMDSVKDRREEKEEIHYVHEDSNMLSYLTFDETDIDKQVSSLPESRGESILSQSFQQTDQASFHVRNQELPLTNGLDRDWLDFHGNLSVNKTIVTDNRFRRSVRPLKVVEIPETTSDLKLALDVNYAERYAFKDPAPKILDINPVIGTIQLKQGERMDYENAPEIDFTVIITRVDDLSYYDEQQIKIRLLDENDELPQFHNIPRPFLAMISSNTAPGSSVYQLMARDDDKDSLVEYMLESGGEDRFEVDRQSGIVRTKGSRPFPSGKEFELGVSAVDVRAPVLQKSATHSLKILVGERNPQFFETQYVAAVNETSEKQFEVVKVRALSHCGYPITYELTTESGGQSNEFAIDQQTGVVDLLRKLDYERDAHQYHLKVKAVENRRPAAATSTVNLIINLVDQNDNSPTFPLSQYIVQGISETIPIGSEIIQVTATDVDSSENAHLTYSVSDANFTVLSVNNVAIVKTAKRLDFDRISDHTYNFTITATDGGSPPLKGMASVRVSVTNVNDEDPVFTQSIEYVQVSEDASSNTVIHVVQAYDPDGDDVSYSFAGNQLRHGPFRIDSTSGIISLVHALDKTKVSYKLNITATDDGRCCGSANSRSNHGVVIVEVKDINNNAPRFVDCSNYNPTILEKENVGTFVIKVAAVDLDTGTNGNVTYSLVRSTDQGLDRFDIDPVTGVITSADVFDREAKIGVIDYGLTVKAEDHGSPTLAGFCTFRVKIGDKNDNPPVFNVHEYSTVIEESSPIGRKVKQVYATDRDAGDNSKIEYVIKRDPSGFFTINPHNGWVTVARPMNGQRRVVLEIMARDKGSPPKSTEVRMVVEITQTTNEYPRWVEDYSAVTIRLSENVPVNHPVKRFRANSTVPDALVNYFISPGDTPEQNGEPKSFYHQLDKETNEMVLLTYRPLDYEALSRYTLTIKAANRAVNSLHIDMQVVIELIDSNDEIPQFIGLDENGRYPGSIAENLAPGAEVITVTATDKDEFPAFKKITYEIKPVGEDHKKFSIDRESGVIRALASFDRELKNEYYITVVALDGAPSNRSNHQPPGTPNQGEAEVQVRVTDMNDNAPYFKERQYTARVPENTDIGTAVITVMAEDEDEENSLTYSITAGNIGSAFEVVPDLGEIKVRGQLDYETGPRLYRLTYRVFDDKFANSTSIIIHILDVNDNPPVFDKIIYSVNNLTEEELSISKSNPKYLLTVRATDPDIERKSKIRYRLTGQFSDDGTFIINEHSGEISLTRSLDRDPPHGRPMWNFNVLAHDEVDSITQPSLTGYSEVRIMLQDVNDNAPVFDVHRLTGSVPEHSKSGMNVLTVKATDADNGNNGSITYSLTRVPTKNGKPLFSIDSQTGLITTLHGEVLDRETTPEYHVVVIAKDRGLPSMSSTATATVLIEDINDHIPVFTQKFYQAEMSESLPIGASIISVSATDEDIGANAKLMYSLKESDRRYFTIATVKATNTGVLKVHKEVDYDTLVSSTFNLTVYVEDTDTSHVDVAYIRVQVTDYNDNAPVFSPNQQRVTVYENVTVGTTLFRFSASDLDTGRNRHFGYSIDRITDPDRKFSVNNNGLVTTALTLDRERKPEHRVHILAVDNGYPPQTGTGTLFVILTDVNDNYPEFAANYRPVVYENQPIGQFVVEVSATDRDTANNGPPFEFWVPCRGHCPCADNPTCGLFSFTYKPDGGENRHGSGVIKSLVTFDREKQKEYHMPIVIKDSGNPVMSGTNTLTIVIGDLNDNIHHPGHKDIVVYSYKGLFENIALGNVYAQDEDDWDIANKTFTFADDDTKNYFRLDADSGQLYMNGRLLVGQYDFHVKVYDVFWRRQVTSTVRVTIRNIDETAVLSSGSLRLQGTTAEQFLEVPASSSTQISRCKYDVLREHLAKRLSVPIENVDIFNVRDHESLPGVVDIRYSAHGSPYYRPEKLDGLMSLDKDEFEQLLGLKMLMTPVDECLEERCNGGGCTNALVVTNEPLVVNTNATSLIGVTAYVEAKCICEAREFGLKNRSCHSFCLNGGTCIKQESNHVCSCPPGFNGLRCQQTHRSFDGNGWAWFRPLSQCEDSHTSLEIMTSVEDGLILYNGPLFRQSKDELGDFILLEMRNGYPLLRIDHGSGELKLSIDGRDKLNHPRLSKLSDGQWHRIDIFRSGKFVRLLVDRCENSVIEENETMQTSVEDRRPCESVGETPGENRYVNVNQPLQLGGRMAPPMATMNYPLNAMQDGFNGCIKNLVHNGELYDLYVGSAGEQKNSADGCGREDLTCGVDNPQRLNCGPNGTCIGSFQGNFRCVCQPGWRGSRCSVRTTVRDFGANSFIEWELTEQFHADLSQSKHKTSLQLMFRTHQNSAHLFKAMNAHKSEYVLLEIKDYRIWFRYNIGNEEQAVTLSHVNVSDGVWHTVWVERVGKWAELRLDIGEGSCFNESFGAIDGHLEINVNQRNLFLGGDVRFPSSSSPPLVDHDFNNGCINDVRFNGEWLPMDESEDSESRAARYGVRSQNVAAGCSSSDFCLQGLVTCAPPLVCTSFWRQAQCRCPPGQRLMLGYSGEVCVGINECAEIDGICQGGQCHDLPDGYKCQCSNGYVGETCAEPSEQAAVYVSAGALLIMLICAVLFLLIILLFIVYSFGQRKQRSYMNDVGPDDDVRENIIHYDEEGVGEQDQTGYDITQLRMPVVDPRQMRHYQPVERIVEPSYPNKSQPTSLRRHHPPDVESYINDRLEEADNSPDCPPFESVREYAYEGEGSAAGSLSSLASISDDNDQDWDYLNSWGPRFYKLADMYNATDS